MVSKYILLILIQIVRFRRFNLIETTAETQDMPNSSKYLWISFENCFCKEVEKCCCNSPLLCRKWSMSRTFSKIQIHIEYQPDSEENLPRIHLIWTSNKFPLDLQFPPENEYYGDSTPKHKGRNVVLSYK